MLAPQVGFEPTTLRLTAECSTVELLRSMSLPSLRVRAFYLARSCRTWASPIKTHPTYRDSPLPPFRMLR